MCETKVYLAGKIKSNDWRQKFVDIRGEFICWDCEGKKDWYMKELKYKDMKIVGPWFISCDHSCYHGEGSHGLGVNAYVACTGADPLPETFVIDVCRKQIDKADVLFAYIDDDTCYGTLAEIGYAKGLRKKIVLLFDTEKRKKDMWFVSNMGDMSFTKDEVRNGGLNDPLSWYREDLVKIARELINRIL